jgi:hypothetical protein
MRPAGPHRALIAVITVVFGAAVILMPRRSHATEKQVRPKIA